MKYILNAFSLNMVVAFPANIIVREVVESMAQGLAVGTPSGVGHADTAAVFSSVLGTTVAMNRATVALTAGDEVLVGQYVGPRLAEGTTTLPEGATIKWLVVSVQ